MVLDIGGNMLVVRVGAGKRRVIRMRKRIVPVELLLVGIGRPAILGSIRDVLWGPGARNLVAVALDHPQLKVQMLLYTEGNPAFEKEHPLHAPKKRTRGDVDQRRSLDRRVTLTYAVKVHFVGLR
jgi:hypothetical protein